MQGIFSAVSAGVLADALLEAMPGTVVHLLNVISSVSVPLSCCSSDDGHSVTVHCPAGAAELRRVVQDELTTLC
ncbi:hypothetical protein RRG08_036367 [Elysia crispata]|uniref:Uncharacterized protein n=1 Tax=Elysia crispata TaxID=231223 RepID=A0AAE0ZK18_9GAST|nr:hypothetical protein RRG08_036367 [Elysia crispata]